MALYDFNGKKPVIDSTSWIAESAQIIGDVKIGKGCWIGPNAVIRGDFGTIIIGDETAVEDGVVIHTPSCITIGSGVIIGHLAMLHNRSIGDYSVIGMNSTLSDNAEVGNWVIIAEHSLVKKNQTVPDYRLYAGIPAQDKGEITDAHRESMVKGKRMYDNLVNQYLTGVSRIDP
ncbi:MAG: gamma carbonic anhydrase family protein [Desulfomonilia bacterium]